MTLSNSQIDEQEEFNDEDWSRVTDPQERKRIQNRLAQRNYRKNLKQRIEALERVAAEHEKSASSLFKEQLKTTSRTQRQKKNSNSISESLQGLDQHGHMHEISQTSNLSEQHFNPSLEHLESASQVTTLTNDSHMIQYLPTERLSKHQKAWNDVQNEFLSPLGGFDSPDLHSRFDFNLSSCNSLGADLMHLSSSASQFLSGTQTPASNDGSMDWSQHCSTASLNALSRASSERERKSDEELDKRYDVEEKNPISLSRTESEDLIPQSWKPCLLGDEVSNPSSSSSETRTSRLQARKKSATKSPAASESISTTNTLSTRLSYAIASIKALGFASVEDLLTQFWTADLSDRPSLAGNQRLSRRRELPRMLSELRGCSNGWSDWESQGWRDEVTRSAEEVLTEECRRYLLKENELLSPHSQSLSPEEALTFKSTFQTELPNLYALLETLSDTSGRVGIDEAGDAEVAVNAIFILLHSQMLCFPRKKSLERI